MGPSAMRRGASFWFFTERLQVILEHVDEQRPVDGKQLLETHLIVLACGSRDCAAAGIHPRIGQRSLPFPQIGEPPFIFWPGPPG
jgi:hypothetical protein